MKRLCFFCFWMSDYSRLVRRYVAKEYYALSDDQLLSIPFFASIPQKDEFNVDSSKGTFQRKKKVTLNDLGPEILVKEKALEIHTSLEQVRRVRNLEYEESQRRHWEVLSSNCFDNSLIPDNFCPLPPKRPRRNTNTGSLSKNVTRRT